MCQDPLEVKTKFNYIFILFICMLLFFTEVFWLIRQEAGPNDHPSTPTFLHLYKILSVYSILKPPKYGNCTVNDSDAPRISLTDLHEIFQDKTTQKTKKINRLKKKLDELIEYGLWEPS